MLDLISFIGILDCDLNKDNDFYIENANALSKYNLA